MSQWCPPGETLCCLCFGCFPKAALAVDEDGTTWDVCKNCWAMEAAAKTQREAHDGTRP